MIFQGAKWLKIQALLDGSELKSLFQCLGEVKIFPLGIPMEAQSFPIEADAYVSSYASWVDALKKGEIPSGDALRTLNMTLWCEDETSVTISELKNGRYLVRPKKASLQVQIHSMGYSTVDRTFRPMVLGQDTIFWGLQWSFPQVGQDPQTGEIFELKPHPWFVKIRQWTRDNAIPTPMLVDGVKTHLPIKIGKQCLSWIGQHPQLAKLGVACAVN
jgi:hypothetical protein